MCCVRECRSVGVADIIVVSNGSDDREQNDDDTAENDCENISTNI